MMQLNCFFLTFLLAFKTNDAVAQINNTIVRISSGALRGTVTENDIGERVYAFLGIPFAKPPIGDLRFKVPQPEEPWSGIRNATKAGNPCYQEDIFFDTGLSGSEDCLYLNVFTKNIDDSKSLKPVMVFIHGGSYLMGSADPETYSPKFLMGEDIVFVSLNYRLGVFGFLRLNDTSLGVTGNAGLKDQVLALKWVQKNINQFGGDPNNVTIFGESAGSGSVNYHVLSPSSEGLFHKAILQSGTVLDPWAQLHPKSLDLLKYFNLEDKSQSEIVETIMKIPAIQLIEAQTKLYHELKTTFKLFAPCVEQPNDSAFLTESPINVIRSGSYNKVPMIIGFNSNEGLGYKLSQHDFFPNPNTVEEFVPPFFVATDDIEFEKKMIEKMRKTYQIETNPDNEFLALTDSLFAAGIIGFVRNAVKTNPNPIFLYEFNFVGSKNILRIALNISDRYKGACHGDDMGYIFATTLFKLPSDPDSEKTTKRMVKMWTNFAKYGNPTPDNQQMEVTWPPVEKENQCYLHIDRELTIKSDPYPERIKLWREVYNANIETKDFIP